jgi:hypothetical protein
MTAGIPGSGISYTQSIGGSNRRAKPRRGLRDWINSHDPNYVADQQQQEQQSAEIDVEQRNRALKLTFDRAAEGQSKEMRELMAYIVLIFTQHPEYSAETAYYAVVQQFPNANGNQITFAMSLLNDELTQVRQELDAEAEAKGARADAIGGTIGKLLALGLFGGAAWAFLTAHFGIFFLLIAVIWVICKIA